MGLRSDADRVLAKWGSKGVGSVHRHPFLSPAYLSGLIAFVAHSVGQSRGFSVWTRLVMDAGALSFGLFILRRLRVSSGKMCAMDTLVDVALLTGAKIVDLPVDRHALAALSDLEAERRFGTSAASYVSRYWRVGRRRRSLMALSVVILVLAVLMAPSPWGLIPLGLCVVTVSADLILKAMQRRELAKAVAELCDELPLQSGLDPLPLGRPEQYREWCAQRGLSAYDFAATGSG